MSAELRSVLAARGVAPSSGEEEDPRKLRRAASRVMRTLSALRSMKAGAAGAAAARAPDAAPAMPLVRDATAVKRGWRAKRRVGVLPPAVESERGGAHSAAASGSEGDGGEGAAVAADAVRLGFGSPPPPPAAGL